MPEVAAAATAASTAPDPWIPIALSVFALFVSGASFLTGIYWRRSDRREKRIQSTRDMAANDFEREIREPITVHLAGLSGFGLELKNLNSLEQLNVSDVRDRLTKLCRTDISLIFDRIFENISICGNFSSLRHIDITPFAQDIQDQLLDRLNGCLADCGSIGKSAAALDRASAAIASASSKLRAELARVQNEIKSPSDPIGVGTSLSSR